MIRRLRVPLLAMTCTLISSIAWAQAPDQTSQRYFSPATIVSINAATPGVRTDRHVDWGNPRTPGKGVYYTRHPLPNGAIIQLQSPILGKDPVSHFDTTLPLGNLPKPGDRVCIEWEIRGSSPAIVAIFHGVLPGCAQQATDPVSID